MSFHRREIDNNKTSPADIANQNQLGQVMVNAGPQPNPLPLEGIFSAAISPEILISSVLHMIKSTLEQQMVDINTILNPLKACLWLSKDINDPSLNKYKEEIVRTMLALVSRENISEEDPRFMGLQVVTVQQLEKQKFDLTFIQSLFAGKVICYEDLMKMKAGDGNLISFAKPIDVYDNNTNEAYIAYWKLYFNKHFSNDKQNNDEQPKDKVEFYESLHTIVFTPLAIEALLDYLITLENDVNEEAEEFKWHAFAFLQSSALNVGGGETGYVAAIKEFIANQLSIKSKQPTSKLCKILNCERIITQQEKEEILKKEKEKILKANADSAPPNVLPSLPPNVLPYQDVIQTFRNRLVKFSDERVLEPLSGVERVHIQYNKAFPSHVQKAQITPSEEENTVSSTEEEEKTLIQFNDMSPQQSLLTPEEEDEIALSSPKTAETTYKYFTQDLVDLMKGDGRLSRDEAEDLSPRKLWTPQPGEKTIAAKHKIVKIILNETVGRDHYGMPCINIVEEDYEGHLDVLKSCLLLLKEQNDDESNFLRKNVSYCMGRIMTTLTGHPIRVMTQQEIDAVKYNTDFIEAIFENKIFLPAEKLIKEEVSIDNDALSALFFDDLYPTEYSLIPYWKLFFSNSPQKNDLLQNNKELDDKLKTIVELPTALESLLLYLRSLENDNSKESNQFKYRAIAYLLDKQKNVIYNNNADLTTLLESNIISINDCNDPTSPFPENTFVYSAVILVLAARKHGNKISKFTEEEIRLIEEKSIAFWRGQLNQGPTSQAIQNQSNEINMPELEESCEMFMTTIAKKLDSTNPLKTKLSVLEAETFPSPASITSALPPEPEPTNPLMLGGLKDFANYEENSFSKSDDKSSLDESKVESSLDESDNESSVEETKVESSLSKRNDESNEKMKISIDPVPTINPETINNIRIDTLSEDGNNPPAALSSQHQNVGPLPKQASQIDTDMANVISGLEAYARDRETTLTGFPRFFIQILDPTRGERRKDIYLYIIKNDNFSVRTKQIAIYALLASNDGSTLKKAVKKKLGGNVPAWLIALEKNMKNLTTDHFKLIEKAKAQLVKYANSDEPINPKKLKEEVFKGLLNDKENKYLDSEAAKIKAAIKKKKNIDSKHHFNLIKWF